MQPELAFNLNIKWGTDNCLQFSPDATLAPGSPQCYSLLCKTDQIFTKSQCSHPADVNLHNIFPLSG